MFKMKDVCRLELPGILCSTSLVLLGLASEAMANPNFGRARIEASGTYEISGHTGGNISLALMEPESQQNGPCLGYAELEADHILEFVPSANQSTVHLSIEVNSNGEDTTLLVERPDGKIYCYDDEGRGSDAHLQASGWPSGEYNIWVGAFEPGMSYRYNLTVSQ